MENFIATGPGQRHRPGSSFGRAGEIQHPQLLNRIFQKIFFKKLSQHLKENGINNLTWLCILDCSSRHSKVSRNSIMQGSVSKSVKWLLTHRRTTRVTLSRTVGSLKLSRDNERRGMK
jgi:hypothetical protein